MEIHKARANGYVLVFLGIVLFTLSCVALSATSEDFDNAAQIAPGSQTGTLDDTNKQDMYRIRLESGSIITVDFTSEAEYNQALTLYNPSREKSFYMNSKNGAIESETIHLANETEPDDWYVGIESSNAGDYSFTVSVKYQDDGGTGIDLAADYATALDVGTGKEVAGHLHGADKSDMYKVHIESGSIVTLEFTSEADYNQNIYLYNPKREKALNIYKKAGALGTETIHLANETASGYWFVEVESSNAGDYRFTVSTRSQDDGGSGIDLAADYASALEVETGKETTGHLEGLDKKDMYKVYVESGSIVTVSFTSEAVYNQNLILDNTGREKALDIDSKNGAIGTETIHLANETASGYWYVQVGSSNTGDYRFTVSVEEQDDGGSGIDVAADYASALEIETGREIAGHLEDLDKMDVYKVYVESGSIVTVTFTSEAGYNQGLVLYDPGREKALYFDSKNGAIGTDTFYLANETASDYWYVEIESSNAGDYLFNVSLDEQNDGGSGIDVAADYDHAFEIGTGIETAGHLEDLDKKDMFSLLLNTNTVVAISFESQAEYAQYLRLFNPQRERHLEISSSQGTIGSDTIELADGTESGTWYIEVEVYGVGDYVFNVSVSAGAGAVSPTSAVPSVPTSGPIASPTTAGGPAPEGTHLQAGVQCTTGSECASGNCRYVCCNEGETCCSGDAHCSEAERCDMGRSYCMHSEATPLPTEKPMGQVTQEDVASEISTTNELLITAEEKGLDTDAIEAVVADAERELVAENVVKAYQLAFDARIRVERALGSVKKVVGKSCGTDTECATGNCNNVCCMGGYVCCTTDAHCKEEDSCDTERFYCVGPEGEPVSAEPRGFIDTIIRYKEIIEVGILVMAGIGALAAFFGRRRRTQPAPVQQQAPVTAEGWNAAQQQPPAAWNAAPQQQAYQGEDYSGYWDQSYNSSSAYYPSQQQVATQEAAPQGGSECPYCGATFITKMARCPHCGANL